eukprot:Em0001g3003a
MHLVKRKAVNKEEMGWRCPRKGCRQEVALREGTFFEGSRLGIETIMRIVYLWSVKTPLGKMREEIEFAAQTAVDWYNFIRDICAQYFIDHPSIIGGPGFEIEIDESKFGKRKYNRGRQARAFSRAGDPGKCLGVCKQAFGQLKRQGQSMDPRCWQLGAHLYVVVGACVVAAKGTKTKVKLTKQDDAGEYFLMAFQLCFPFSSVLLLKETCLWLSSCMAEALPLLAGHFLSLGMQLTLTHQAVYSIGQKLR